MQVPLLGPESRQGSFWLLVLGVTSVQCYCWDDSFFLPMGFIHLGYAVNYAGMKQRSVWSSETLGKVCAGPCRSTFWALESRNWVLCWRWVLRLQPTEELPWPAKQPMQEGHLALAHWSLLCEGQASLSISSGFSEPVHQSAATFQTQSTSVKLPGQECSQQPAGLTIPRDTALGRGQWEHWVQFCLSQHKKGINYPEWVQGRSGGGLEQVMRKEKLRQRVYFSLEKEQLKGYLLAAWSYRLGSCREDESRFLWEIHSERAKGNRHSLEDRKFQLAIKNFFSLEEQEKVEQIGWGRAGVSILGDAQNSRGQVQSKQISCSRSCWYWIRLTTPVLSNINFFVIL